MGKPGARLADLDGDPLAVDGFSCTVCHQVQPERLGTPASFSGRFRVGEDAEIYGPHVAPFARPMERHAGYTPVASDHMLEPALCGTCHTLKPEDTLTVPHIQGVARVPQGFDRVAAIEVEDDDTVRLIAESGVSQSVKCHAGFTKTGALPGLIA